jgi:signal recognition particle subunit SRP68
MKKITINTINEAGIGTKKGKDPLRYLLILMTCAERCWAHSMALKQEANTEHRKKFHMMRKLEKAVIYARCLHGLSIDEESKCDARTKLETEAYLCYMKSMFAFETAKWKKAAILLKKCQAIYTKLLEAISDEETCRVYQSRVDELNPTLRYCAFSLGEKDGPLNLDILKPGSLDDEFLVSKLDTLILQAREKQAEQLSNVSWLGKTMSIKHEKIKTFLMLIKDTSGLKVGQLERLLFECRDCLQLLRENNQEKSALYAYLQYHRYNLTILRNLGVLQPLETNIEKIRPYEVIVGCLEDMKALDLQQFNPTDVSLFLEKIDAEIMCYKSFRTYFIAKSGKIDWKESVALLHRCTLYIQEALDHPVVEDKLKQDLQDLLKQAESDKYSIYAGGLIEDPKDIAKSSLKVLSKRLDVYLEDPKVITGEVPLTEFPPNFKPIPCKPLFFDLALNHIEMPSLEEETTEGSSGGLTGFVKGLLGGGWKK